MENKTHPKRVAAIHDLSDSLPFSLALKASGVPTMRKQITASVLILNKVSPTF